MSINKVILIGNCGKVPEVRSLQGGAKVATVTLATTEKYKDREETEWHTITFWNNLAEVVEKYVDKGSQLYVEGKIKTEKFKGSDGTDKYVTRIVASTLHLLGSKKDRQSAPQSPASQQRPQTTPLPTTDNSDGSDDLPW